MKESPKDFPNAKFEKGMVILYIKNTLSPEIRHAAKLVPKFATPKTEKSPIPSFTTPHTNRKILTGLHFCKISNKKCNICEIFVNTQKTVHIFDDFFVSNERGNRTA